MRRLPAGAKNKSYFPRLFWSRLPEGQLLTGTDIAAWLVRPQTSQWQIFPTANLAELADRHQRVAEQLEARPLGSLEEDFGYYVTSLQAAFLSAPVRHTLRALWRTLTRQRAYRREIVSPT